MGASRWQIARADPAKASWLSVLIAACLAYPFYTLGLQDRSVGLGGIVATFIFAAITALRVRKSSPKAALLLLPLLAWLCFAFVLVITVLRLNHA
jgi:tryptophan-rich sensory protein